MPNFRDTIFKVPIALSLLILALPAMAVACKVTGVIAGRSAKITAESQVRNEYATAKTFGYQVVFEDMSGKVFGGR